jgi:outer membrane protein TolC
MQYSKVLLSLLWMVVSNSSHAVTLGDAIDSALRIDPSLRASKLNQLASEENISIARSRLLPQISLQGSSSQLAQTTTQDLVSGGNASRSFSGPSVNHQLVIRQAIIRPREFSSLRYAELQSHYMKLKYKQDEAELKSRVINAWIDLLGAKKIAQVYEKPLAMLQAAAKQEWAKLENGDGTQDASIEAEAQYENAKANFVQALETLKARESIFEKLTKISSKSFAEKTILLQPEKKFSEFERMTVWENYRDKSIDLQMAKLQELMQLERVVMAEADHKPTFDLMAAVNLAQNDATSTQGYQYKNKQIGVQYTVPLFSGGGITATARQASFGYESSLNESEAVALRISNEFESLWGQVLGGGVRQIALTNLLNSSVEQLSAARRGLDLGVKSISEVAAATNTLARREVDLINASQEYYRNLLKIKKFEYQ